MMGHDVVRIGTDIRVSDDADILSLATREERILVTHDQDFGDLIFLKRHRSPFGVILFRYEPTHPEEVARRLQTMIRSGLQVFHEHLTAVDENKIRQVKC